MRGLKLTGQLAGHTGVLGMVRYTNGVAWFPQLSDEDFARVRIVQERSYQAVEVSFDGGRAVQGGEPGGVVETDPDGARPEDGRPPEEAAPGREVDAGGETGDAGIPAEGSGQERPSPEDVRLAALSLDPLSDDNWTSDGRPRVDAVERALGHGGLRRADVDEVANDVRRDGSHRAPEIPVGRPGPTSTRIPDFVLDSVSGIPKGDPDLD